MINPRPNLLSEMLGCKPSHLTKHTKTVWGWRGLLFEVLTYKQMREGKIPPSHYSPIRYAGKAWRIRELGKKSKLYKEING